MKVWGINLPIVEIEADCFDKAIRKARQINKNYCSGQIKD